MVTVLQESFNICAAYKTTSYCIVPIQIAPSLFTTNIKCSVKVSLTTLI